MSSGELVLWEAIESCYVENDLGRGVSSLSFREEHFGCSAEARCKGSKTGDREIRYDYYIGTGKR